MMILMISEKFVSGVDVVLNEILFIGYNNMF